MTADQKTEISVSEKEDDVDDAPRDKYRLIYILFFLLGLFHLLPWSFFTTATEFWMYKFRNTSINETKSEFRTELQAEFNASLKITLQVSDIAFLILSLLFGHHISVRTRMIGIVGTITSFFLAITIFTKVNTDEWQTGFFALTMAISAGINAMNAVFTITFYTVLAHFPHVYLTAYLLGAGLSGIFTSSLQIVSLSFGLSTQDSALVYFLVGLLVLFMALVGVVLTNRNRFYVYHMSKNLDKNDGGIGITFKEGLYLLKKIWSSVLMLGLFFLSLDLVPLALVVSEEEGNGIWSDTYFIPTITYLLAAVTSLLGRGISFVVMPEWSGVTWNLVAFARILIFTPLLVLCNAQPRNHLPVLLPHDYQYILISSVFHFTGGYLLSRTSYQIIKLVEKDELKKAYHVNMLCAGLWMGVFSFVSIVSVKIL